MAKITKDHVKQGAKQVRMSLAQLESAVEQDRTNIEARLRDFNDKTDSLDTIVANYASGTR